MDHLGSMRNKAALLHEQGPIAPEQLDSWKQIAKYFDRDVRTVRRWEIERALPVHRLPGRDRSGVFAYVGELEHWRQGLTATDRPLAPNDALEMEEAAVPSPEIEGARHTANAQQETLNRELAVRFSNALSTRQVYAMAALVLVLTAIGVMGFTRHHKMQGVLANAHIASPPAEELYLQGRFFWSQRTESSLTHAVDLFSQAIDRDRKFAPAYAGLADSYILLREFGHMPDAQAFPHALLAARQAVALDESSPDGHRSLGFVLNHWIWDFPAANREFRRALELNPNDAQSHHWFASALWSQGQVAQAREQIDLAQALDPQSITILSERALFYEELDRTAALATWRQLEQTRPEIPLPHEYIAQRSLMQGDTTTFLSEGRILARLHKSSEEAALMDASERTLHQNGPQAMV